MRLKPILLVAALLSFAAELFAAPPAAPPPVELAPGVKLELVIAGSGDGQFLVTPRPISKAQFEAFATQAKFRTEAERGTSGGYGFDPATGKTVQRAGFSWRSPGFDQAPGDPVVDVTKADAQAFLTWASGKAGRTLSLPTSQRWEQAVAALPLERSAKPGTSVREWTADMAPATPGQPERAILRGASWLKDVPKGTDPAKLSNEASPASRQPDYGFRACAELTAKSADNTRAGRTAEPPLNAAAMADMAPPAQAAANPQGTAQTIDYPANSASMVGEMSIRPRPTFALLTLLIPLIVVVAIGFAVVAFIKKLQGPSSPIGSGGMPPSTPSPSAPTNGGSSEPSAVAVNGGIQVRANVPAGTRIQISWSGAPDGSMVAAYQPGPQGMFIPVAGVVHGPRAALVSSDGVVPNASIAPTDNGFQVTGAVADGTIIHAAWTNADGSEHQGSARYDGVKGYAAFQTGQPIARAAVSLRPLTSTARLPSAPPQAAVQLPAGAFGAGGPRTMIHSHQSDDGFWTGFWMSNVLHPSHPSMLSSQRYPNNPSSYGSSFDDTPSVPSGSTSLFGGNEPAAYH